MPDFDDRICEVEHETPEITIKRQTLRFEWDGAGAAAKICWVGGTAGWNRYPIVQSESEPIPMLIPGVRLLCLV